MKPAGLLAIALGFLCIGVLNGTPVNEPIKTPKPLREGVLKASSDTDKAKAYRKLFENVGRVGLADLMKDEDIGIALQAAWEFHKKAIKRPMVIEDRADDIYDAAELGKFVVFVKERTKAPVPDWWAEAIVDVMLFPGQHHAFNKLPQNPIPKLRKSKSGMLVPEGAELEQDENAVVYSDGCWKIEFPKTTFDSRFDAMLGLVAEKQSVIVSYFTLRGCPFQMAGFKGRGGKPSWKADIWAAGRIVSSGASLVNHWMELTEKDGSVFVFGAESHGMYVESFDIVTGKCRFKFCTCYWFDCSERWGLK